MTVLSINPASPCDAPDISDLLQRSYAALLVPDYEPAVLRAALPKMTQARPNLLACPTYFVARRGACAVGAGGWTHVTPFGRPGVAGVGHIRHLACDPACLREGVARAIMQRVFETAHEAGIDLLCCLSTLNAVPFYRAMGFGAGAEVALQLTPEVVFPAVEMRRGTRLDI
jgi:GNAT superfamily N-acetyltransferase